jgi:hypothetical protein
VTAGLVDAPGSPGRECRIWKVDGEDLKVWRAEVYLLSCWQSIGSVVEEDEGAVVLIVVEFGCEGYEGCLLCLTCVSS